MDYLEATSDTLPTFQKKTMTVHIVLGKLSSY